MRPASVPVLTLTAALLLTPTAPSVAADPTPPTPQQIDFFEKKIRPVLTEHCYQCHSADAEKNKKLKGSLFLDTRDGLLKGGDSGPAIVPGKAAESMLVKTLHYAAGEVQMPPKGKVSEAVIADFEKWENMGAPDPRVAAGGPKKQIGMSIEAGRNFWSYKPVTAPAVPAVKDANWPASAIDRFIMAKL